MEKDNMNIEMDILDWIDCLDKDYKEGMEEELKKFLHSFHHGKYTHEIWNKMFTDFCAELNADIPEECVLTEVPGNWCSDCPRNWNCDLQ